MTLNWWALWIYIIIMYISPLGILRIFDVGLGIGTILFLIQLGIYVFVGGFHTMNRHRAWTAKKEWAEKVKKGEVDTPRGQLDKIMEEERYGDGEMVEAKFEFG